MPKPIFQTNINRLVAVHSALAYSRKMDTNETLVLLSIENDKKLTEACKLISEAINKLSQID